MAVDIVHLQPDNLLHEYGLHTQRLFPWDVLNAPFESSWALALPRTRSTLHSHHEHEIFIAVNGEAVIESEGERAPFRAGAIVYFRPGQAHRVVNDSGADFEMYSIWWDAAMAERFGTSSAGEHT